LLHRRVVVPEVQRYVFNAQPNMLPKVNLLGVVLQPPGPDLHPEALEGEVVASHEVVAVVRIDEAREEGLGEVLGDANVVLEGDAGGRKRALHGGQGVASRRTVKPDVGGVGEQLGRLNIHLRRGVDDDEVLRRAANVVKPRHGGQLVMKSPSSLLGRSPCRRRRKQHLGGSRPWRGGGACDVAGLHREGRRRKPTARGGRRGGRAWRWLLRVRAETSPVA
jgi:hypothetical protein